MNSDMHIPPNGPENGNTDRLREEKLLAYLEGKLPPAEQHEVELWLADEGMENDAVEGLQGMTAPERSASINKLNHKLKRTLGTKKRRTRTIKTDNNVLVAVFIILLLAIAAYCVIRYSG